MNQHKTCVRINWSFKFGIVMRQELWFGTILGTVSVVTPRMGLGAPFGLWLRSKLGTTLGSTCKKKLE